jgi:hypothetical protein
MVEELRFAFELAACCVFWCGTSLLSTALFDGFLSAPLPGGGGVASCFVRLFWWGVCFGALCTIAASSYMIWQCSCP